MMDSALKKQGTVHFSLPYSVVQQTVMTNSDGQSLQKHYEYLQSCDYCKALCREFHSNLAVVYGCRNRSFEFRSVL